MVVSVIVAVAPEAVAVISAPTKLIVVIAVPTGVLSSWIVRPLIAVPPLAVFAALQVQPPEPFALITKFADPVPPLVSCIPVGFIFGMVSKLVLAL